MPVLTSRKVESARCAPGEKPFKLRDEHHGLFCRVSPTGKVWYVRLRTHGRDTAHRLGDFPKTDLKEARRLAAIKQGETPTAPAEPKASDTFGAALDNHIATHRDEWREATRTRQSWLAERLTPLRKRPLAEIDAAELVEFLRGIAETGQKETAHRLRSLIESVFDDAVILRQVKENPAARIGRHLPKREQKGHAAITDRREFGKLLLAIEKYDERIASRSLVSFALAMLALNPTRKTELLTMRWSDVDLKHPDGPLWSIPDDAVKTKVKLAVPLSRQSVDILRGVEIYGDVAGGGLVFEGRAGSGEPLSENAIGSALKSLGYAGKQTAHGFRSSFSTLAHEKGWRSDLIELAEGRKVGGVKGRYLRSTLLEERRKLMQDWADYCDELKAEAHRAE